MGRPLNVLVTVLVGVVVGCSGRPDGAEYSWLSAGARTTYDMKVLTPSTGVIHGTMITRQDGTIAIGGQTYYKSVTTLEGVPGAAEPEVSYQRLGRDGIYSRKSVDASAQDVLDIPLPPEVGRKWSSSHGDLVLENSIVAIEDVDTAEKTYRKCLRVQGNGTKGGGTIQIVSYYAPQIGLIRSSMVLGNGVSIELKRRQE